MIPKRRSRRSIFAIAFALPLILVAAVFVRTAPAATPLTTVHPSYTLTSLRPATTFQPMVGGMGFLSDGRLVVGHWGGTRTACCPSGNTGGRQYTGKVYVMSGVTGDSPNISIDTIVSGLEDIMGLVVLRDTIYVSGGNQILRLIRNGNTGPVTRIDTVFILPGTPQTSGVNAGDSLKPQKGRSEWLYGMLVRNDTFFVAPSSMYNSGTTQINPFRGTVLAVTLGNGTSNKRGSFRIQSMGYRHQTGLAFGPEGSIWTTETQGPWIPANKLIHAKQGAFYGHKHTPAETWDNLPETPAAVFLPQGTTTAGGSTGGSGTMNATGVFSNSPGGPLYLTQGLYAGQILLGDVSWGGIQRYFLEKVNGEWQGAGFPWMGGLEGGPYRMLEGPDGQIYVGMIGATGDWSWNGQFYGLQKLKYSGTPSFEMLAARSRAQGMEIEFTLPVDTTAAKLASNWTVSTYYYQPTSNYGGTQTGNATLTISSIQISPDRKSVYLGLSGLVPRVASTTTTPGTNRIVEITLNANIRSATSASPRTNKAYYTLNAISNTGPFGGPVSIDARLDAKRLGDALTWTVSGGALNVRAPFQGAYTLRLTDLRGSLLASASGRGEGEQRFAVAAIRGGVATLEAIGDGVTLRKTILVP